MYKFKIISALLVFVVIMGIFSIHVNAEPFRTTPQIVVQSQAVIGLKADGTVIVTGSDTALAQLEPMTKWENIVQLSDCGTVGLKADGTVLSVYEDVQAEVGNWKNITQIATFGDAVLGLREDGTVLYTGYPEYLWWWYEDDEIPIVMEQINDWTDIKALGRGDTPCAIRNDGTVISIYDETNNRTANWSNITTFAVTDEGWNYLGLKNDGFIVGNWYQANWDNIIDFAVVDHGADISDGMNTSFIVALKSDGTIITSGYMVGNGYNFTEDDTIIKKYENEWGNTEFQINHPATRWTDIIKISITSNGWGLYAVAGLDSNGKVFVNEHHENQRLQEAVKDWNLYDVNNNTITLGKLSDNDKIGTVDLIILAKSLAGRIELTNNQKLSADLNDDGEVTSDDLLVFIKYLVGAISTLPYNG